MNNTDKIEIAHMVFNKLDDTDINHYDYQVLSDQEYYKLTSAQEAELAKTHSS